MDGVSKPEREDPETDVMKRQDESLEEEDDRESSCVSPSYQSISVSEDISPQDNLTENQISPVNKQNANKQTTDFNYIFTDDDTKFNGEEGSEKDASCNKLTTDKVKYNVNNLKFKEQLSKTEDKSMNFLREIWKSSVSSDDESHNGAETSKNILVNVAPKAPTEHSVSHVTKEYSHDNILLENVKSFEKRGDNYRNSEEQNIWEEEKFHHSKKVGNLYSSGQYFKDPMKKCFPDNLSDDESGSNDSDNGDCIIRNNLTSYQRECHNSCSCTGSSLVLALPQGCRQLLIVTSLSSGSARNRMPLMIYSGVGDYDDSVEENHEYLNYGDSQLGTSKQHSEVPNSQNKSTEDNILPTGDTLRTKKSDSDDFMLNDGITSKTNSFNNNTSNISIIRKDLNHQRNVHSFSDTSDNISSGQWSNVQAKTKKQRPKGEDKNPKQESERSFTTSEISSPSFSSTDDEFWDWNKEFKHDQNFSQSEDEHYGEWNYGRQSNNHDGYVETDQKNYNKGKKAERCPFHHHHHHHHHACHHGDETVQSHKYNEQDKPFQTDYTDSDRNKDCPEPRFPGGHYHGSGRHDYKYSYGSMSKYGTCSRYYEKSDGDTDAEYQERTETDDSIEYQRCLSYYGIPSQQQNKNVQPMISERSNKDVESRQTDTRIMGLMRDRDHVTEEIETVESQVGYKFGDETNYSGNRCQFQKKGSKQKNNDLLESDINIPSLDKASVLMSYDAERIDGKEMNKPNSSDNRQLPTYNKLVLESELRATDLDFPMDNKNQNGSQQTTANMSKTTQFVPHYMQFVNQLNKCGCGNCKNCRVNRTIDMIEALVESVDKEIHDVIPDGNCMFRAVVDQLRMQGELNMTASKLRKDAVNYLKENPYQEDGTHMEMFLSRESWDNYLLRMKEDAEWGDQIVLRGIAEVTNRKIVIISAMGDNHNQTTIEPMKSDQVLGEDISLGHIDDQHYVSLRHKFWQNTWYKRAQKLVGTHKETRNKPTEQNADASSQELNYDPQLSSKQLLRGSVLVDDFSKTPLPHLSLVIINILPMQNLTFSGSIDNYVREFLQGFSEFIVCGSFVEGLQTSLIDYSMYNLGNKSKLSNPNKKKSVTKPNLILENKNYVLCHGNEDEEMREQQERLSASSTDVHPGYVRLIIDDPKGAHGSNLKVIQGKMYMTHPSKNSDYDYGKYMSELDDPDSAIYFGIKCQSWPEESVTSWLHRKRPSGWPGQKLIKRVLQENCLVVPFNHPASTEPKIEWRYSFTVIMKILSKEGLAECQIHCFLVFKVLVDFFTGEKNILSTYFLKTVFYHALQELSMELWDTNMAACLLYLLDNLLLCLQAHSMPHFFIPSNNIIDHLPQSVTAELFTKIQAIRQFPIMALVLLVESHGHTISWVADPIMNDIDNFIQHQDVRRSAIDSFVPTTFKLAQWYLQVYKFSYATTCLMKTLHHLNMAVSLSDLICQATYTLGVDFTWWLCFFLDHSFNTNMLLQIFWYEKGMLLKDILGKDIDPGKFGDINIPHNLLRCTESCQIYGGPLGFLIDFCNKLYYNNLDDHCIHFHRCLIQMLKKRIYNNTEEQESSNQSGVSGPLVVDTPTTIETDFDTTQQSSYYKQVLSSNLYMQLYIALNSLYTIYLTLSQVELFTEYIEDTEEICDVLQTYNAYSLLATAYTALGNRQKAAEARQKANKCQSQS